MARRRRIAQDWAVRGSIRRDIRGGATRAEAIASARSSFRGFPAQRINSIVDAELASADLIDRISLRNINQFTNIAKAGNCPTGTVGIHTRITVTFFDAVQGRMVNFNHSSMMTGVGTLKQIAQRALDDVIREARARGYNAPNITFGRPQDPSTYRFDYMECR